MELARVPSSLVMIQVLLKIEPCRTRGHLGTTRGNLQDYLEHRTRLQHSEACRPGIPRPTNTCGPYPGDDFLHAWTT
jgi:hypothetical protein